MLGFSHSREWVYTAKVQGTFQRVHRWSALALHVFLFVTPWVMISGHPAVRIDLVNRRVYLLGSIFTAADGFMLVLMGLFAAFSLFFFTSLFGRLWCGFLCPQTVLLEEWARRVENWIEGDRGKRMHRDKHPWTWDWTWRKALKLAAFALSAFVVSMSFQAFFAGAPELWTGQAGPVDYGVVAFFTGVWFVDFAWFREQLCNYVCPYARFQGALADDESLVVTYLEGRGEPRARGRASAKEGRCIDCTKCVAVCPAGIDIRDGFQLECISCARCVDACTGVMDKLGHESLVTFSTVAEQEGRKVRLIRPRTVLYGGMLSALATALLALVVFHNPIEASVNRAPGSLYTMDADGFVRNTFILQVTNNDPSEVPVHYAVEVMGLDGAQVIVPPLQVGSTETRRVPVVVRMPAHALEDRTVPIEVRVSSEGRERLLNATFKSDATIDGRGEG